MSASVTETVFLEKDNEIEWLFKEKKYDRSSGKWKETPIDFVSKLKVTKMVLHIDGQSIQSGNEEVSYFDGGLVILKLGSFPGLTAGAYVPVTLDVFSDDMPNGKTLVSPGMKESSASVIIRKP